MYQAGTLSGNPLAMAAGIATLTALKERNGPESLETKTAILAGGLKEKAEKTKEKTETEDTETEESGLNEEKTIKQ